MNKVCEIALERMDPAAKAERIRRREQIKAERSVPSPDFTNSREQAIPTERNPRRTDHAFVSADLERNRNRAGAETRSRYISAEVKREVWLRSEGKCVHCESTFALEFDHIRPFAKGGTNEPANLRLLCRNCNQRHAIESFGGTKMAEQLAREATVNMRWWCNSLLI